MPEHHDSNGQPAADSRPSRRKQRGLPPSEHQRTRPGRGFVRLFAVMAMVAVALVGGAAIVSGPQGASAQGDGSPVTCDTSYSTQEGSSVDAGSGNIITGICFMAGDASGAFTAPAEPANDCGNYDTGGRGMTLHSPCLSGDDATVNAAIPECYTVSGMGTQAVSIATSGDCSVAHIDYATASIAAEAEFSATKAHIPAFDSVNVGDQVTWTILIGDISGQTVTVTDTLPSGFQLDTQSYSFDANVPCTPDLDTETLTCTGTASTTSLKISIRGDATSCGDEFVNTAMVSVGGGEAVPVTDPTAVAVEGCPGAAPYMNLQIKNGLCSAPGADATLLIPGNNYCLWPSTGDYVIEDSWTLSSTGTTGEMFDFYSCSTNSVGVKACEIDSAGGSPHSVEFIPPQDNSFVAGEADFTLDACDPTVTITITYDGPVFATNSAMVELPCQQPGSLQVTKVCDPGDAVGTFSIQLRDDTDMAIGSPVSISCGDEPYVFEDLTPGTYNVTEEDSGGFDIAGNTCSDVVVAAEETAECTITNELPVVIDFLKYTSEEDEILDPGETFQWYIDVGGTSGLWVLSDTLPSGFSLQSVSGAFCRQTRGAGFYCFGSGDTTLTINARAPQSCGVYTNVALLLSYVDHTTKVASDSVSVEGCAGVNSSASSTDSSSSSGSSSSSSSGSRRGSRLGSFFR